MPGNLGMPEIFVILVFALIFLGPKRLPEVGRQVGKAMRELRRVQGDVRAQLDDVLNFDDSPAPAVDVPPVAADVSAADGVAATQSGETPTTEAPASAADAPATPQPSPPPPTTSFS